MSKFNELINGDQPVLVDFYAEWCGPCKTMMPVLDELKNEIGEQGKIVKVDVDKNTQTALKYQVRGVPTFVLFHKGEIKWRQAGVVPKEILKEQIAACQ
ncbi:MAG: thioredoxin [Flavobacteriales bacterium]|nr:thioredoxin [Flavobacteriales bacterium]